jgi:predicted nucleic acid-binding protein
MTSLVIDGSTALGFLMRDEQAPSALKALAAMEDGIQTFVPTHWWLEVANGLLTAERRKRASQADVTEALHLLRALPAVTDDDTGPRSGTDTIALARQYGLTVYDAAYLELAMRHGATLATDDRALGQAAVKAGVAVLGS